MSRPLLGDVLAALLGSLIEGDERVDPISGARLVVHEAEIELPLEGSMARGVDGPLIFAAPPATTLKTGFDLPTQRARMLLVSVDVPAKGAVEEE
jgi:hypothetical protein